MSGDPFGTERVRRVVLDAWRASPRRLREDANAEEDLALGGYRDRVVVELAQNAADAAARAGSPGRLLLRLADGPTGPVLVAANTGAPLDAEGLASLTSLRASAKRSGGEVGRFGVGFAAVRSVSDEITLATAAGAVHLGLAPTAAALAALGSPDVDREVARRGAALPVLRLPWPGAAPSAAAGETTPPADGETAPRPAPAGPSADDDRAPWATVVTLALRDDRAVEAVRRQLADLDDGLLLALPALAEVVVEADGSRVLTDVARRWVVVRTSVEATAEMLADRPVEERGRVRVSVAWAAPRPGTTAGRLVPSAVHAPTPTDEPCTLPALLVADLPLDSTRRHIAPGPLTDHVLERAGELWGDLVVACRAGAGSGADGDAPDPLALVPAGAPAGWVDAGLREGALRAMAATPLLDPAAGGPPLAPAEAVVVEGPAGEDRALTAALGARVRALVTADPRHRRALRALGVEEQSLADVVDALPDLGPAEHRALLDALDALRTSSGGTGAAQREALATVPVPLADGRTVRGLRGAVVLDTALSAQDVATLGAWGVRVVHPDAVHPRHPALGATPLDLDALVRHPAVREHVLEGEDDAAAAALVLDLLGRALAAGETPAPEPWWGEVLLVAQDGEGAPARGLVLPGSPAAGWFDPLVLPPVDPALVERYGAVVLGLLGVREGLPVLDLDPEGPDAELVTAGLDGWEDYVEEVGGLPPAQEVVADLDAVRDGAWPDVLAALVREAPRSLRPPATGVPSWTAWWLRRRLGLGGPFRLGGPSWLGEPYRLNGPRGLARSSTGDGPATSAPAGAATPSPMGVPSLLPSAPPTVRDLPDAVQRALGGVDDAADVDAAGWAVLLEEVPEGRRVQAEEAVACWRALVGLARAGREVDLVAVPALAPARADAPAGEAEGAGRFLVTAADDVVVGSLRWAGHPGRPALVVVPEGAVGAVADACDLDAAEDRLEGRVTSRGAAAPVPAAVARAWPAVPQTWWRHRSLEVDGRACPAGWWVQDGDVHAEAEGGLARALAEVVGVGADTVARVLADPEAVADVLLEEAGRG